MVVAAGAVSDPAVAPPSSAPAPAAADGPPGATAVVVVMAVHTNGRRFSWTVRTCLFKLDFWLKVDEQRVHEKERVPGAAGAPPPPTPPVDAPPPFMPPGRPAPVPVVDEVTRPVPSEGADFVALAESGGGCGG